MLSGAWFSAPERNPGAAPVLRAWEGAGWQGARLHASPFPEALSCSPQGRANQREEAGTGGWRKPCNFLVQNHGPTSPESLTHSWCTVTSATGGRGHDRCLLNRPGPFLHPGSISTTTFAPVEALDLDTSRTGSQKGPRYSACSRPARRDQRPTQPCPSCQTGCEANGRSTWGCYCDTVA